MLADLAAGILPETPRSGTEFDTLVLRRNAATFDRSRSQALDDHERRRGRTVGRPRLKVTRTSELLALAADA